MKLLDKVAVVTGAAGGIGKEIAKRYAVEGAKVVVADIDGDEARRTASEIGGNAVSFPLDVTSQKSIDALFAATFEQLGSVEILVNNAAVFDMSPILETTREEYERIFSVNVEGLLFTLQAAARQMVEHEVKGRIINMASLAGRRGAPLVGVYCASKAAVISLTQSAGLGLIKHGINVNAISPGYVDTPMWEEADALFARYEQRPVGEKKRLVGEQVPFGRMGVPEDHTGAAVFLASDDAEYVVAQTLNVDGGTWMS